MSNSRPSLIEENIKCSCKGSNLDKLLQPNILMILAKQNLHGYMVIQALERRNLFNDEKADNAGVYRTLKTLEDREMVRFEWVLDETGPAKKNYYITDKGLACLSHWIETLEVYKHGIEKIIEDAKEALKEDVQEMRQRA
jgi:DNA-binding PadR family transcriptional regulator